MSLANYAAGAIMMPYQPFLEAADRHRYDIDRLCAEFGASVEQVAHRLTTLARSGARGVPFFMLRAAAAGHLKASTRASVSRVGGTVTRLTCTAPSIRRGSLFPLFSRLRTGRAFHHRQSGGARSGSTARGQPVAIGLGCDLKYAGKLGYADGLDRANPLVTPIGPACTLCPRPRCPQRAAPPAGRTLTVNETRKTVSPFPFLGG